MYAAYDPELDRKIALKILHPGADAGGRARERLLREAQALARLSHPNVVAVHDVGTHEGQVFVAMEFIAGATLSATIAKQRPSSAEILRLYRAAGEGLAAAHRAGLVHRDFKPDNVMVGSDGRVRVVDFGLAHAAVEANPDGAQDLAAAPSGLTATGALMGTPAYMAPEQYLGRPTDARTDVFAYCVALYEHLHGRRPFAGETLVELAQAVTSGKLPEVTAGGTRVPSAVRRILLRGLARDPADRYPSMEALLADLDRALARPRRRVVWIAGGVLGLVAAGAAAFALGRPDRAEAGCRRIADEFAGVWSPEAREAGARAFSATGLA
ncbi:MAG TPA: serine/threonine-protein kinase, partial [Nannocystis sp.]